MPRQREHRETGVKERISSDQLRLRIRFQDPGPDDGVDALVYEPFVG